MSDVVSPSNKNTWKFITDNLSGIKIIKRGRGVQIEYGGEQIFLPPYPEIESVSLVREGGLIIPKDIPNDWVAQWKANGSNIRIFAINDVLIAITRGGYLLDWKPYQSLTLSALKEMLINAVSDGRYVLFGELVGPKSLVRLCVNEWRNFIGGDIGYILFDVYDRENNEFIPMRQVEALAKEHNLLFPPTEWALDFKKLNEKMSEFLKICDGEMWEGFVFKNKERGELKTIKEKTKKWRLDETREFATQIYKRRLRNPLSWKIFEALRKFILEGYLDPPITIDSANEKVMEMRSSILEMLEKASDKSLRERIDKEIRKALERLLDTILSAEILKEKATKKAKKEAIKMFRKIYIWSQ